MIGAFLLAAEKKIYIDCVCQLDRHFLSNNIQGTVVRRKIQNNNNNKQIVFRDFRDLIEIT